jgi:hypothetical protein
MRLIRCLIDPLRSTRASKDYWMPACAGMTPEMWQL